jgi:hypothetical protein
VAFFVFGFFCCGPSSKSIWRTRFLPLQQTRVVPTTLPLSCAQADACNCQIKATLIATGAGRRQLMRLESQLVVQVFTNPFTIG